MKRNWVALGDDAIKMELINKFDHSVFVGTSQFTLRFYRNRNYYCIKSNPSVHHMPKYKLSTKYTPKIGSNRSRTKDKFFVLSWSTSWFENFTFCLEQSVIIGIFGKNTIKIRKFRVKQQTNFL